MDMQLADIPPPQVVVVLCPLQCRRVAIHAIGIPVMDMQVAYTPSNCSRVVLLVIVDGLQQVQLLVALRIFTQLKLHTQTTKMVMQHDVYKD